MDSKRKYDSRQSVTSQLSDEANTKFKYNLMELDGIDKN